MPDRSKSELPRIALETRSVPSVGSSSAPSPSHDTPGSAAVSIVTSLQRSSASAKQSNPGPRLAEVAGAEAAAEGWSWLTLAAYSGLA